jgi:hypothetical protein
MYDKMRYLFTEIGFPPGGIGGDFDLYHKRSNEPSPLCPVLATLKLLPVEALPLHEQDGRLIQVERTTVKNTGRGLGQTGSRSRGIKKR